MNIPKKISPDSIRDSIIAIVFESDLPFEVLIGIVFKSLDDSYLYGPMLPQKLFKETTPFNIIPTFTNELISFSLTSNSLVFNCIDEYKGWEIFQKEIQKILQQIYDNKYFNKFKRVSARYISGYPNVELKSCVNFNFSFGMPDINSKNFSFRSEFIFKESTIILNLHDKILLPNKNILIPIFENATQDNVGSIIDVDVINNGLSETTLDGLIKVIDDVHLNEKQVFFSIIKQDFLETLRPQY